MSTSSTGGQATTAAGSPASSSPMLLGFAWLVVGVPLVYGVWQTLVKAAKLFTG